MRLRSRGSSRRDRQHAAGREGRGEAEEAEVLFGAALRALARHEYRKLSRAH
jgi:hypothetical protein